MRGTKWPEAEEEEEEERGKKEMQAESAILSQASPLGVESCESIGKVLRGTYGRCRK